MKSELIPPTLRILLIHRAKTKTAVQCIDAGNLLDLEPFDQLMLLGNKVIENFRRAKRLTPPKYIEITLCKQDAAIYAMYKTSQKYFVAVLKTTS